MGTGVTTYTATAAHSPIIVSGVPGGTYTVKVTEQSAVGASGAGTGPGNVTVAGAAPSNLIATGATGTQVYNPSGMSTSSGADNTSAIQNAINSAASSGGIVQLPPGTYYLGSHPQAKSNVTIVGSGSNGSPTTSLKAGSGFYNSQGPNGGYPIITTNGADNVTLSNFITDGSSDQYQGVGDERLSGYQIDMRNSTNILCEYMETLLPISYQIVACGSNHFSIVHCTVHNASNGYDQCDGIHILDSNTGEVRYNTVDNRLGTAGDDGTVAHTINAPVYGITYANNYVRGGNNGGGMQFAVGNYPIHDIVVQDSEFYGAPYGIRTGGYDNKNGGQYNITIQRCNIHDVVGGTDWSDGSGPSCSVGNYYEANGQATNIVVSNLRVCNFNTAPGNAVQGSLVGCSGASPVVGSLGA